MNDRPNILFIVSDQLSAAARPPTRNFSKSAANSSWKTTASLTEFGDRGRQSMEGRPSPLDFDEAQEGWIANTCIDLMRRAAD